MIQGLEGFLGLLETLELKPRTVGATDYPRSSPLDEVIAVMGECSGAIVLGYPQIKFRDGIVKGAPASSEMCLPTEWNHIEAGLAYARGLPLLVIHHIGVQRGIFDRGALNSFVYSKNFADASWPL